MELSNIPSAPGVYIFKDKKDRVLYIGKAKNLLNRLKSYLQHRELEPRKLKMIEEIHDVSYIVTSNEFEALVLESNLIKQYRPPFNIVLRDDKNYPYIRITLSEHWPKIDVVRNPKKDGNLYFGPYVPAQSMWEAISFIRKNFPIRTCKNNLNKQKRPCVQYQMKRCPAPCAGFIKKEDYMKGVEEVILFLRGKKTELLRKLHEKMKQLSEEWKFEEAAIVRDQIKRIEKIFEQQRVVSIQLEDMDVLGVYIENSKISVNVLFVRNGLLVGSKNYLIKKAFYETQQELIISIIETLYSKETLIPPKILILQTVPEDLYHLIEWLKQKRGDNVEIRQPYSEEELNLMDMSLTNATVYLKTQISDIEKTIEELRERLNLNDSPLKIGAFDISTLFGMHSVGSFIYWEDGGFNKAFYRHLKIKDALKMDDYSAMKEVVLRIIKKFEKEAGIPKPDLILIDGGKGHLNTVIKVIKDLKVDIEVFAVAKDPDRLVFKDGREISLEDKSSSSLLLRKIRNEAHKFAISYHKKLRKKAAFESVLQKIPGIGKKRRLALLRHFKSIPNIKKANLEELASLPGFTIKLAQKVIEELNRYS